MKKVISMIKQLDEKIGEMKQEDFNFRVYMGVFLFVIAPMLTFGLWHYI